MRYKPIIAATVFVAVLACGWPNAGCAMTAEELLALKKAGVSDETIRMMLQQEKDGKRPAAGDVPGKREIRDSQGGVSIEYSTGRSMSSAGADTQQLQVDKAWEMLRHLLVDTRKSN